MSIKLQYEGNVFCGVTTFAQSRSLVKSDGGTMVDIKFNRRVRIAAITAFPACLFLFFA